MKLVLNRTVIGELFHVMEAAENKFQLRVSLAGAKREGRIIVESIYRSDQPGNSACDLSRIIGEMVFHPECIYWLRPSEKRRAAGVLKQKEEFTLVVAQVSSCGDLAFYPVYFSRRFPQGLDMALTYDGVTVRQERSALISPSEETKQRRLGVKHRSLGKSL
jgi:hypothetical protein